jgi:GNAT superfamily N-acetyltransferase
LWFSGKKSMYIKEVLTDYFVSTDKAQLQFDVIHNFLKQSYWAKDIPEEKLRLAIDNALCFGVYHHDKQVGFARVVTDYAVMAYIGDVFIIEEERGKGLSKLLMKAIVEHPQLQTLRRIILATRDAHGLYEQFGFKPMVYPERWMERPRPDAY